MSCQTKRKGSMDKVRKRSTKRAPDVEGAIAILFRHKRIALFIALGVFVTLFILSLSLPKQYTSTLKLLVKSERTDLVVSPEASPTTPARSEVTESQVNSDIALLTTNEVLTEVVRRCHL